MPTVSVIIPTYNRHIFLRCAIISVLNQTFQDFEIIVVDDASAGNDAFTIVRDFNDRRIKYVRHELNKGLSASRNTGIKSSSGKYIALLDDDDEWLPEKLALQITLLENSSPLVGVIYTGCLRVDKASGKELRRILPSKNGYIFNDLKKADYVIAGGSTALLRRECFDKIGLFDEGIPAWEAYDMWIRLSKYFHFDYIEEPLVKYYCHENSMNTDFKLLIKGIETMIEKYGGYFKQYKKGYSYRFFILGFLYCIDKDMNKGRKFLLKALLLYPFTFKYYFYLVLSLAGTNRFKQLIGIKEKILSLLRHSKIQHADYAVP